MTVEVEIFVRDLEAGDRLKDYVTKKASKLDRYLNEVDEAKVDLSYIKSARSANDRYVAQITVRGRHVLLRTEERAEDIRAAFDNAIDNMQRQMEHYKGKHHHGRGNLRTAEAVTLPLQEEATEKTPLFARRKTFTLDPMSEAEALEQMKLLGHDNFFIFFNIEAGAINVLYRRRDGTYGLIEPKIK